MRQRRLEILLSETEAHPTDEQLDENDALTMDRSIRHHYANHSRVLSRYPDPVITFNQPG